MGKIRTLAAVGEKDLSKTLEENPRYEIIKGDILYKEGILEFLETKKDVDLIIINKNLPGEISIEDLKSRVKKINKEIRIEIVQNLEEYMLKIKPEIEIELPEDELKTLVCNSKVIGIFGAPGIGKSTIAKVLEVYNKNKKVKIIELELEEEYSLEKIEEEIVKEKLGNDIILIDGLEKIKNISNFNFKLLNEILIISGANLVEIKKSINLYTKANLMKRKQKLKVLFNKVSRASIEDSILRGAFNNVKIVGKIKYNDLFDYTSNIEEYEALLEEEDVKEFLKNLKI